MSRRYSQSELEDRLEHSLRKMEETIVVAEAAAKELSRLKDEQFDACVWLQMYVKTADALARHVTGEIRGNCSEKFRFPDRLVRSDYYNAKKLYSGEAEDDATEALRRLKRKKNYELRLDALSNRRQSVHEIMRDAEAVLPSSARLTNRDFPSETLQYKHTEIKRTNVQKIQEKKTQRLKQKKRKVVAIESIEMLKRAAGVAPERLEAASSRLQDEIGDEIEIVVRNDDDITDGEALFGLEKIGNYGDESLKLARRRLRRALQDDEVFSPEDICHRRRALGRNLRMCKQYSLAVHELNAALRTALSQKVSPLEVERCYIDRGLLYLDRGRGQYDAALALHDFEESKQLASQHNLRDAKARATYNCGLARLAMETAEDSRRAILEFRAARTLFEAIATAPESNEDAKLATEFMKHADDYINDSMNAQTQNDTKRTKPQTAAAVIVPPSIRRQSSKKKKTQATAELILWKADEDHDIIFFPEPKESALSLVVKTVLNDEEMTQVLQTHIQVERLRCLDCRLQRLPQLNNIQCLTLRRCGLTLAALSAINQTPALRELDISSNPLGLKVAETNGLKSLITSHIRCLDLSDCAADASPLVATAIYEAIQKIVILKRISLAANVFTATDWSRILSVLPAPSELLDLRYTSALVHADTGVSGDALSTLIASASVVRLGFADLLSVVSTEKQRIRFSASLSLDIQAVADTAQSILSEHAPVLQCLDLSDNAIQFEAFQNMHRLRRLRARRCGLSTLAVINIIQILPTLRVLDVAENLAEIETQSKWLENKETILRLRYLDLSDSTLIAAEDATKLAQAWLSSSHTDNKRTERVVFLQDTTFRLSEKKRIDRDSTYEAANDDDDDSEYAFS